MSINAVGSSPVNYAQVKNAPTKQNVSFSGSEAKGVSKGKKVAKSFASGVFTGLGQMCDGRVKDGLKQLGAHFGFALTALAGSTVAMSAKNKVGQIASLTAVAVGAIGSIATKIYSIVDAYKGGK